MAYPFKWVPISDELKAFRKPLFEERSSQQGGVVSEPMGIYMPDKMARDCELIYNFKLRPDDVWIVTYPKCGTTWAAEMVWQIVHNVDVDKAKEIPHNNRSPFFEVQVVANNDNVQSIKRVDEMPSPRVIKTHLPLEMLPPKLLDTCKVLFVGRNPKDTCVSFFNHFTFMRGVYYTGTFDQYAQMFLDGTLLYGSYWAMLKSAYKQKNHPNMKIIWFEDMKKDLKSIIGETCNFLGKHLTEYRILKLDDLLYVDNFRKLVTESYPDDPGFAKFVRKGIVGDWKNYFNDEQTKIWNAWIAKNLEGTEIKMTFE